MADTPLIALDWGTTSLRAYRLGQGGAVAEARQLPCGIMRVTADGSGGFDHAFEQACGDWLSPGTASPIIACGMIGSAQGWRETAYLEVPTSLDDLAGALVEIKTRRGNALHVIPGVIECGPLPGLMRGEETQVAGAVDLGTAPARPGADTWIGLPGTHSKWVRVWDRRIVQLHTFMTGEVYAALCAHTILGRTMRPPAIADLAAFDRGVDVARSPAGRGGVLSTIFSTRALGLVGGLAAEAQADYLSGLLVGHELAALAQLGADLAPIVLVGSDELCQRYRRALATFGHAATIAPNATERGLWRVAGAAGLVPRGDAC